MKKIGKLFLALGIIAFFAGCKKPTDEIVELTKIEITNPADKLEYLVGEDLDTTGLEITATYSDETTKVVTDWTPSGYDKTKAGEQTVKITYTENEITVETSYTVTVKEVPVEPEDPGKAPENPGDSDNKDPSNEPPKEPPKVEITKIEIEAEPTQREYFVGPQELNLTGLKVTATYTDGTTPDVTDKVTTSGFDPTAAVESQTITVTYEGKTATFTVKIIAVEVTKIEITTEPTRKVYYIGSSALDLTGMVVTATYNNGTTADVTKNVTTSGFVSTAATESQTITVTYGGKTATFTVKILAVTKIEITAEPTQREYFVGAQELNLTGLKVTATYTDGTTADVTDKVTTTGFDSTAAVDSQTITVTYEGKTAIFTVKIKQGYTFHNTVTTLAPGITGSYGTDATYVLFGDWPQNVVSVNDVTTLGLETSTDKVTRGYMDFVQGTDGNYYVKHESKWYKVMPIKWRVFDEAYDVDGNTGSETGKLLVAENILTANVPYYEDYQNNRKIDNKTVYPNNYKYSQIRAYLNGNTYTGYDTTTSSNIEKSQWQGKGFLQTAFTNEAINKIITTKVDNSKEQMSYDGTNGMKEEYACDPTDDKIFLLSEKEVVQYSKEEYEAFGEENSRIRVTTDFAKAYHSYQNITHGYDCFYRLRSPSYHDSSFARYVYNNGFANSEDFVFALYGVVPALSISF